MTLEIVDVPNGESESLLEEALPVMYRADHRLEHMAHRRFRGLGQSFRATRAAKCRADGPTRTLRKVAAPVPALTKSEIRPMSKPDDVVSEAP